MDALSSQSRPTVAASRQRRTLLTRSTIDALRVSQVIDGLYKGLIFMDLMDKKADQKGNEPGSCLFRRLIRRHVPSCISDDVSSAQGVEMASSSRTDGDILLSSDEYVKYNRSLLSLQPWIFRKSNHKDDWEGMERNEDFSKGDLLSPNNRSPQFRLGNTQHQHYAKPHSSCFVSQISNAHLRIDDYVFSPMPSSTVLAMRPLLITDQNGIISRSHYGSSGLQPGNGQHEYSLEVGSSIQSETLVYKEAGGISSDVHGTLVGIPPLPESKKSKRRIKRVRYRRLHTMDSKSSHKISRSEGPLDDMFHFCLGISFGVMLTVLSNRRENEKLNKLLKHSQDLVQDLQDELEMKDTLTVKEVENEIPQIQEVNHYCSSDEGYIDLSHFTSEERDEHDSQKLHRHVESSQSLSKIEADLAAELERLEQNVSASDIQRRIYELSEIDPDLIGDVVQGELTTDLLEGGTRGQPDGNNDSSSTACTHNPNYSVSPKELSLRLHELIQIRQEERIRELETELLRNRKQLHKMEAEREGAFSNSDIGSSSNQESPTVELSDTPLCLNLSEDALYAYEEFAKMAETKTPPPSSKWVDVYMVNQSDNVTENVATWKRMFSSAEFDDMVGGDRECSEGDVSDDEEGRKLIQMIMEKTRQGSPAVLYARRMLSLIDEI